MNCVNIQCHLFKCSIDKSIDVVRCLTNLFHCTLNLYMESIEMLLSDFIQNNVFLKKTCILISFCEDLTQFNLCHLPLMQLCTELDTLLRIVDMSVAPK